MDLYVFILLTVIAAFIPFVDSLKPLLSSSSSSSSPSPPLSSSSFIKKALLIPAALGLSFGLYTVLPTSIPLTLQAIIKTPQSLTCTLDTQLVDEYHDSCQLLPSIVRFRANKVITIKQDWGGSSSTGAAVWNGANMLSWYMENIITSTVIKDKSVLELGSGVGFSSIVSSLLGSNDVVISDGSDEVLKIANDNIRLNISKNNQNKIKIQRLRWNVVEDETSVKPNDKSKDTFDYIIAADVTYLKKNRSDLFNTIRHLSGVDTITLLSMEPRNVDEIENVYNEAKLKGLSIKDVSYQLPIDKEKEQCSLLCARLFILQKI